MPNTLTVDILTPIGLDLTAQIDGLLDVEFVSDNGTTAIFSTGVMGTEIALDYVSLRGEIAVNGFDLIIDGDVAATAIYEAPVSTGESSWVAYETWPFQTLFDDTSYDVGGANGDDNVEGGGFNDRFQLAGGDDSAQGGQGEDIILGGRGADLLIGGADGDLLGGGKDSDLLIFGTGNDRGRGGDANDIIVSDAGNNTSWGGDGTDFLILDQGSQTRHMDALNGNDVLLFTGFNLGDNPDLGANAESLADVVNGTVNGFQWRETPAGLEIQAGDAVLQLAGMTAKDIDLDRLYFNASPSDDLVSGLLDAESGTFGQSLVYDEITWTYVVNGSVATLADGTTVEFGTW